MATGSTNGLSAINGLSALNGLSAMNGLSAINGLSAMNGLSSTAGIVSGGLLMNTSGGRDTLSYLVRCALPAGHTITKKDQAGNSYTFAGALGLAPNWETKPATADDKRWVSACLMAHINTTGQHIPIYLDGLGKLGWGRNPAYPIQEGTFFGDIFSSPPTAYYCGGRGYGSNVVAGRIGDDGQAGEPYTAYKDVYGGSRCDNACTRDPSGDGYTICGRQTDLITVWRQFARTPDVSFETGILDMAPQSGGAPAKVSLVTDKYIHGTHSLLATINANGSDRAIIQSFQATKAIKPGKNMTVFVNVPVGTNWSYIQAFVQDGPAKNYRWTNEGYTSDQVLPGEWNSIVVPVPANFAVSGSRMGVELSLTGKGTIKVYVDAISFDD